MILAILFSVGFGIVLALFAGIMAQPDVPADSQAVEALAGLLNWVALLSPFGQITVYTFFGLSTVIFVEGGIFIYKGVMWVLKKVPFINLK